jgi:hypothetical protein
MHESSDPGSLQTRIDAAVSGLRYTPYLDSYAAALQERLERAASSGGLAGIERALDEFDAMALGDDLSRARYALYLFLIHHSDLAQLGLHVARRPEPPR